jgi:hypothetical protein
MKISKRILGTAALAAAMMLTISCKDTYKSKTTAVEDDVDQNEMTMTESAQTSKAESVLNDYFNLKDALVGDDNSSAKNLGITLTKSLKSFNASGYSDNEQSKLKEIIKAATEHAARIGDSDIEQQREHFKMLSKDITAMVDVTGTETKLYEQFCPMYDGGTAWLSMNEEVRNPYYGSSMLKCGVVQREIN